MTTILNSKTVTARKRHFCEWCGTHIEPGETYDREATVSDGDFFALKAHTSCNRLIHALWAAGDYNDDEGIAPYEFQDLVKEEWREAHGTQEATWPEKLEWCKQKYGVSDRLDQLYFSNEDAIHCETLRDHLEWAKGEGKTEITLCRAIPAPPGYDFVWCAQCAEAVPRYDCRKGNCDNYSSRPKARRGEGCADRGHTYLHGDVETFKVE